MSEYKLSSQACILSTAFQACGALKAVEPSEGGWLTKKATRGGNTVEGDRGRRTHTYRIVTWPASDPILCFLPPCLACHHGETL